MYTFQNQVNDEEKLGGKLSAEDKKKLLDACKETIGWIDDHATSATKEDFDAQREKLSAVAHPITSKLYTDQTGGGEEPLAHDEL